MRSIEAQGISSSLLKHHFLSDRRCEPFACQASRPYLGLHVGVVVVLEEESGGLGVIFPCGDVQRGQADLSLRVIFQQEGNHLVMALLQRHRQRSETVLRTERKLRPAGGSLTDTS